mmetsp:Transcript_18528/g.45460  ORF Transcript_18528/g.45460 Transcript_18528/m.45460 type:complete len:168 (+) Transcript_18528:678-1181(+)
MCGVKLKSLDVTRIKTVGERALRAVGETCKELQTLRMYACESFSDVALSHVAKGCRYLQVLDVCGAKTLTDKGIESIAKGCPRLQVLNCTWCVNLTDKALESLSRCKFLCNLSVHGLKHLTDRGLASLASGCHEIVVLDLNGCCNIKNRQLEALQKMFPRLNHLVML